MMLIEQGDVAVAALPLEAFRAHLRLGTGFAQDDVQEVVLAGFLRAAMAVIEARTGRILLEREFVWTSGRAATGDEVILPVAPVSAIVSVTQVTGDGERRGIAAGAWRLVPDAARPALVGIGGWRPTVPPGGSLEIGVLAGFGPDWSDIPADLGQAVMMLAAQYYEYRHDITRPEGAMPFGVAALIEPYRPIRLTAGGAA